MTALPPILDYTNKIILGDCLDVMRKMPDGCVDLVLTDPPFRIDATGRGIKKKSVCYDKIAEYSNTKADFFNKQILSEYLRLCKTPNVFMFCSQNDLLSILSFVDSHKLKFSILALCKSNLMPFSNKTWFTNEYAVHFYDKSPAKSKLYSDKIPYYIANSERKTSHPNEKPMNFIAQILRNISSEDDIVLDPFIGSGTTALCAAALNRRFVGIELNPEYHKMATERVAAETNNLFTIKGSTQ